jgi:hypothetical protein
MRQDKFSLFCVAAHPGLAQITLDFEQVIFYSIARSGGAE